ncbi:YIP1 family protein [Vitiosangium sp. GDMCC 1.1324]|uniref:YIP1 family protein n=1 Tax=Vitiosangium sp. (strain GDMCC 1.1324) TaxID=2138576 RepID=UPI000D3B3E72|nr:YIP1 family protein [Vitiosangium sp. GDMCC 1.1324]PTL81201.1 YIP1 family protein [Vitiosangium sp. GDMCC 1.1324]
MSIPCPRCQQPITPGATHCQSCGSSLLLEAAPGGAEPTCAVHPTLRSLAICDRCGAFACARCLRAGPRGEVVCEACLTRDPDEPLPWDQREELGTLKAVWRTAVNVMLHPDFFAKARPEGSPSSSLLFALLCALPGWFTTGLTYMGMFSLMPSLAPESQTQSASDSMAMMKWAGVGMLAFCVLLGPVISLVSTVLMAGIDHLILRMGGVTRGYAVTLRAHSMSQAPWLLGVVPFIGMQVGPLWAMVARVFAYRGLHRTTWGVALAGALLAPLLTCCLCGGGYLAIILAAIGKVGH